LLDYVSSVQFLEFSWLFFHCDCNNKLLWAEDTLHTHSNQFLFVGLHGCR